MEKMTPDDWVLCALVVVAFLVIYSIALFSVMRRHRRQQPRDGEKENEDAPN